MIVILKNRAFFVRTAIIVIFLRNSFFVRTVIMVAMLYIPAVHIFEVVHFFLSDYWGHLCLLPLRSASAFDTWTYVVD